MWKKFGGVEFRAEDVRAVFWYYDEELAEDGLIVKPKQSEEPNKVQIVLDGFSNMQIILTDVSMDEFQEWWNEYRQE